MQKKYTECLNDLMDYFILTDIYRLSEFQKSNNLSNNLLEEFTSSEYGDDAVLTGVITPIKGVKNFPYTIYFSRSSESAFIKPESNVQHKKRGYVLEVSNSRVFLLTMPFFQNWTEASHKLALKRPYYDLDNGLYEIEIVCGEILQDDDWEPAFEFIFHLLDDSSKMSADINYAFEVESRSY